MCSNTNCLNTNCFNTNCLNTNFLNTNCLKTNCFNTNCSNTNCSNTNCSNTDCQICTNCSNTNCSNSKILEFAKLNEVGCITLSWYRGYSRIVTIKRSLVRILSPDYHDFASNFTLLILSRLQRLDGSDGKRLRLLFISN